MIAGAVVVAAFGGRVPAVNQAGIDAAKGAVTLALGLIGMMALWLGFMRVLREAGLLASLGRALAPLMRRLFPDVPAEHPAMGAMIMNMGANMLGLGNAATPFGLKAMRELETLNPRPGVATNAMALFLAMNTSGVAVFPLGVIALRAELGSERAAAIFVPSILATFCSTVVAVLVAKWLQGRRRFAVDAADAANTAGASADDTRDGAGAGGSEPPALADGIVGLHDAEDIAAVQPSADPLRRGMMWAFWMAMAAALVWQVAGAPDAAGRLAVAREVREAWLLPALMAAIVLFGFSRRVPVYEAFIRGAREGFDIAIMIIPFLVAILVAVGVFRASGGLDAIIAAIGPLTSALGFPGEALPMALIRPLSGSGAMGVMTETMSQYGPDSFVGYLVSVMNGSTETTFYVLALYLGSVRVRAARHTVAACLAADFTGICAALLWSRLLY